MKILICESMDYTVMEYVTALGNAYSGISIRHCNGLPDVDRHNVMLLWFIMNAPKFSWNYEELSNLYHRRILKFLVSRIPDNKWIDLLKYEYIEYLVHYVDTSKDTTIIKAFLLLKEKYIELSKGHDELDMMV
jgi:hypothetical protein